MTSGGNPPPTAPPTQWSEAGAPPASSPPGQRPDSVSTIEGASRPQGSLPPRASSGGTPARAASLKVPRMIPWSDPNENAFSCPVPEGWSVRGGLVRLNALDIRPELLVMSPDGQVLVRIGDSFIGQMVNFNQAMQAYGFPEGSTYGPYGVQMLVLRYLPGIRYALDYYLPNRLGQFGGVREQDLPQLSQQAQAIYSRVGLPVRVDTGEAVFDAQTQEGPRKGYIFCQTRLTSSPGLPQGAGAWEVLTLMGYLAAPQREALAEAVFSAMASGFKPNPAWLTRSGPDSGTGRQHRCGNDDGSERDHPGHLREPSASPGPNPRNASGATSGTKRSCRDPNTGETGDRGGPRRPAISGGNTPTKSSAWTQARTARTIPTPGSTNWKRWIDDNSYQHKQNGYHKYYLIFYLYFYL